MKAAVNDHVDRDMLLENDVAEDAGLAFRDIVIGRDINISNSEEVYSQHSDWLRTFRKSTNMTL